MTRDECREAEHAAAVAYLASTHQDLFTECTQGHEQLDCRDCDGVHCYRSCDTIARASCRRIWKMRIR